MVYYATNHESAQTGIGVYTLSYQWCYPPSGLVVLIGKRTLAGKRIYLIRHGETELNRLGIIQGKGKNPPLNTYGRLQAQAFFNVYNKVPFDAVYTSTLKRSIESVQSFINNGVPHYILPGLDEVDWGKLEGKKMEADMQQHYRALVEKWRQGQTDVSIEGGESPEQVAARQHPAIQAILDNQEERTVLICMHGRAIRVLLCQLLHYPLTRMHIFSHTNLSLYVLRHTGSMCYVSTFNDTAHLNGLGANPAHLTNGGV